MDSALRHRDRCGDHGRADPCGLHRRPPGDRGLLRVRPALPGARLGRARPRPRSGRSPPKRSPRSSNGSAPTTSPRSASPISARPCWPGTGRPASPTALRSSGRTAVPPIVAANWPLRATFRSFESEPGWCSTPTSPARRLHGCWSTATFPSTTPWRSARSTRGWCGSSRVVAVSSPMSPTPAERCCATSGAARGTRNCAS